MYYKCCVENCTSKRQNVKMHRFPTFETGLKKWLQCMNSSKLSNLSVRELRKMHVCHKHFERRFITEKSHVRFGSYPTLFSEEEIESGVPRVIRYPETPVNVSSDHTYNRKKHDDHNYCSTQPSSAETFEPSAEKTHSDDEDWRDIHPAYEENEQRQHNPVADYGVPRSYKITKRQLAALALDKSPNEDAKNGIDPSSIDEFDEPPTEGVFSWQRKETLYPTEDTDVLVCPRVDKSEVKQELGDVSFYDDPADTAVEIDTHTQYQCNVCENEIKGFRYTCVQCADWDLCGACEARSEHAAHYVLRVPSPRPYNEIQAVLAAIRQQLLSENLFLSEQINEDSLKSEPEEQAEEAEGGPEGEAEPDPLRARSAASAPLAPPGSEDEYSDGSEYRPPRRKRRRRRSSDTSDTSGSLSPDAHKTRDSPLYSPEPTNFHALDSARPNQSDTFRRKPVTRSANPVNQMQYTDGKRSSNRTDHKQSEVLEVPAAVYQAPNYMFQVPGMVFEVPGTIIEVPDAMEDTDCIFEVPDNATVFIQEPAKRDSLGVDSVYRRDDAESLEVDTEVLHLRVPPDTDDAALVQALQSQAFVMMETSLEVPDDSTALIQEPPNTSDSLAADSICPREDEVRSLEVNDEVLHLRIPSDTDDAALAQALQSQAYVVLQPLASREVIDDR